VRLKVRFGALAGLASILYAGFVFAIGHYWGAGIIGSCGVMSVLVPWLVLKSKELKATGHLYGSVLLLGITGLCAVSGGITGNAVVWLAAVPLTVLLLVDLRGALTWSALAFAVVVGLAVCELFGYQFPSICPVEWQSEATSLSMVGLVAFLAALGLICEQNRQQAMERLDRANERLEKANGQLQALNAERAEFMNIAAHGLRNPLGIVTGYADLMRLRKDMTSEEVQAGEILCSATRMTDIISNLLDIQAIEEERMELSCQGLNIETLVGKVMEENIALADRKNIEIECHADSDVPQVFADAVATHQIIENLISNAIKYTPVGSDVMVAVRHDRNGDEVEIDVRDTGPGLCEEDQQKLFENFSKLTPRPTGGEANSGLGPWITRRLATAMVGTVICESELGKGSSFRLRLPNFTADRLLNTASRMGRRTEDKPAQAAIEMESQVALPS
jgi:signal transduction histidine kinase